MVAALLKHPERAFTRAMLMRNVYEAHIHVRGRIIYSYIRDIRQKCQQAEAAQVIQTVHGIGYKLGSCT